MFVRPKSIHKLLVLYTRTFLEVLRRDCCAACLGFSLCYTIKVPSKPMLGQKHLCYLWRHLLEMHSVIWEFWNYCDSLTDHVTEKLQTNDALVSTHSTIPVVLSHSKGGWKLKLNSPKSPGKSLNWKKHTCKITHIVCPGVHVHRATLSMEQFQGAVAAHRSCSYMSQSRHRIIEPQKHWGWKRPPRTLSPIINSVLLTHH